MLSGRCAEIAQASSRFTVWIPPAALNQQFITNTSLVPLVGGIATSFGNLLADHHM